MKKLILSFLATASLVFGGMFLVAHAAPIIPVSGGGTQTSSIQNGFLLIGNPSGTYNQIASSSLGGSSYITINGVTSTVFSLNSSTYIGITASGTAFTFTNLGVTSTAGNWAGTWQLYNPSDFLSSSTVYISTTTGNWQGTWKTYNPSDFLSSSTIYIATNTGNWAGTWQNATSGTYYPYSNPLGFVTSTSGGGIASTTPWTLNNLTIVSSTGAITTIPFAYSTTSGTSTAMLTLTPSTTYGSSNINSTDGALNIQNTSNNGVGFQVYSNAGATANSPLMILRADNTAYDQPVLEVLSKSSQFNTPGILLVGSGTVQFGFQDNSYSAPAGRFQLVDRNDNFDIEGRNSTDSGFNIMGIANRPANGGQLVWGGSNTYFNVPTGSGLLTLIQGMSSTIDYFDVSSTSTAIGNIFKISSAGNVNVSGTFNASGTITQAGVPVGFGTVTTSSAGTANTLPLWTSGSALGNSIVSQISTTGINVTGTLSVTATSTFLSSAYVGSTTTSSILTLDILSIPATPALATTTGGTLASSTYYLKIAAVDGLGNETPPSVEANLHATSTAKVSASWSSVSGASYYKIYIATTTGAESLYASTTALTFTFATTTISAGIANPTATSTPAATNKTIQTQFGNGNNFVGGTSTFNGTIVGTNVTLATPKVTSGNSVSLNLSGTNPVVNLTNLNDSNNSGGFQVTYNGIQMGYDGQNNNLYVGQAFNSGNNFIGATGNNGTAVLGTSTLSDILDDGNGNGRFLTSLSVGTTTIPAPNTFSVAGSVGFTGSSTIVTPSIGGAIVTSGCDSATSSVAGYGLSSTTTGFFTTPEIQPGAVSFYSVLTTSSTITTYVCADITITPTSTAYVVKIIK